MVWFQANAQGTKKTVLLVNHAFARGTPAISVILVVSREGVEQ